MIARLAAAVAASLILLVPTRAHADWLLTPFIGTAFAGESTLGDFEQGAGQTKSTYGIAFTILGDGVLGVEGVAAHTPGFFNGDDVDESIFLDSRVTTYMGNVIIAMPLAVTRESLRPYASVGGGLMQARATDVLRVVAINRNLPGISIGGGANGFLSPDVGLRFDVRYLRALGSDDGAFGRAGEARLSFWRASVGVLIRLKS